MDTTTGIRIEVSQELYEKLQDEQEKRRVTTGKKPALSAIILEFCSEKLNMSNNVQTSVHNVHQNVHKTEHVSSDLEKASLRTENQLRQWEERLSRWEKTLLEREKRIKEQEEEIYQEKLTLLDLKSKILDERDKIHQQALEGTEKMVELKLLQKELTHKDDKIQQLTRELGLIKENVHSNNKDRKSVEPKTFWEQVKDYLPWIITGITAIVAYLLAKKGNKPPLPQELKGLAVYFDGLPEKDQKALGEKLKYYANLHAPTANEENFHQVDIKSSGK